jgi:hypothetical protein
MVFCGAARAKTSSRVRTRAVREREVRKLRRDQIKRTLPLGIACFSHHQHLIYQSFAD